jgi:hypothetical protein
VGEVAGILMKLNARPQIDVPAWAIKEHAVYEFEVDHVREHFEEALTIFLSTKVFPTKVKLLQELVIYARERSWTFEETLASLFAQYAGKKFYYFVYGKRKTP